MDAFRKILESRIQSPAFKIFALKDVYIALIQEEFGYSIQRNSISYENGVVSIKGHPALKFSLLTKKEQILEKLRKNTSLTITDLR